jgi:glycosyltransferase involved in cell wall biosynthesis
VHGAESSLVEAARSLLARGVHVHVALPEDGPLGERLAANGVPVTIAGHRWLWWVTSAKLSRIDRVRSGLGVVRRSGKALTDLRAIVGAAKPDVIVSNTMTFPHGALAARLEQRPHVVHVRELVNDDAGLHHFFGDAPSLRVMGAMSSRLVACSNAVAQSLEPYVNPAKIRVVYNAVDAVELPVRVQQADRPLRLLALGRLHPNKGQEDIVRATALLAERGVDVELSLVGDGNREYRSHLMWLAENSAARGRVAFTGFTEAPARHMTQCDVFVMTSRYEPFGRVTVEAMKAGRPVVAAGAGGTVEIVRNRWNGLLYRAGDVADLARQLETLSDDNALRVALATCGQEWARRTFSLERHGADLFEVLSEAARHAPRTRARGIRPVADAA